MKLFNDAMLSRWRSEGFLDFASSNTARATPTYLGSVLRCAPRQGHAREMLRDMLAFEKDAVKAGTEKQAAAADIGLRHPGEEHGGEGVEATAHNPGAREPGRVPVGVCGAH